MDELEINGNPPEIESLPCEALVCQEYWYGGHLEDPANVIYLRFGNCWHRLYFDCGIIFWRQSEVPPEPFQAPETSGEFRLVNLGQSLSLNGRRLLSLRATAIPGGSEVRFDFEGAVSLTFQNVDDRTAYVAI